jgi:hypothetical protein
VVVNNLLEQSTSAPWGQDYLLPQNVSFDVTPSSVYVIDVENYPFEPVLLFVDSEGWMRMETKRSVEADTLPR